MIIGRPSLSIDLFDQDNPTNKVVINSGATTFVKFSVDLTKIAQQIITVDPLKEKAEKFVQDICYKTDGKAAERIVTNIYAAIK